MFDFADSRALVKRVIAHGFNGVENGEAAAAEHFQVNAEALVDDFRERQALGKKSARASNEIPHQAHVAVVKAALDDIVLGKPLDGSGIERNVDAAFVEVARNVLPKICKLQGGAGGVGKALTLLVAIATKAENQAADRVSGIDAVTENRVPIRIAFPGLVLAKRF